MKGCPACGSDEARRWGAEAAELILRCVACGSTYFERPISRPHNYDSYYPYLSGFDAARYRWELQQRRRIFRFQLQTIERMNPPGRRLIEFGAGPGYFCAIAGEMGWRATAIEVSPPAIDAGRREFGVDYGTLESVPKEGCDVITAFHVLEHLESPASLMRVFREKLIAGGVLVVHVPNWESLGAWIHHSVGKLAGRSRDRRGCLYYPEHITGFTTEGLTRCATRAGFELVRLRQRSLLSRFHDPLLARNYFFDVNGMRKRGGTLRLGRHIAEGILDHVGETVGKGDWLVGHFRAR